MPTLKALGVTPVGDERIVAAEGTSIVTCAGVSAGIDLGLWLAGQIGGEDRAKVIQLSMEYDPQPPFDSGHMSKASATTKATATALMGKDLMKPTQLKATTLLLWDQASSGARRGKKRRRARPRDLARAAALSAVSAPKSAPSRVGRVNLAYDDRGSRRARCCSSPAAGARAAPGTCTRCPRSSGPAIACITFDNRGIGATENASGFTTDQMVGDTAALIEKLDAGPVRVVAVSMGSFIAQELMLARPDLVSPRRC